jgi:hypothetical protein
MAFTTKPTRITGTLFFAQHLTTPNTKFNPAETKLECTIGQIPQDQADNLMKEQGVKIKRKKEDTYNMGNFITAKTIKTFRIFDNEGNPVDPKIVGSGTKVTALVSSYEHRMSAMHGPAPSIVKLFVTDLVKYDPTAAVADEADDVL